MRVGIVIARYRRTGGLERVAVQWARGLRNRGHDVVVFAQHVDERDDGIQFVRVGGARSPQWLRAATFPFAAARALGRVPVEVACSFGAAVFAPTVMGTAGPHRAWFEQGRAEAPVFSREGLRRRLNPHHRVVLAVERAIVGGGRYHTVLATSRRSADDYARLYGVPAERLDVLPNGVDLDEFGFDPAVRDRVRTSWDAGDRYVVLSIANEISRKGIDTLIRSFPLVLQAVPDALLVLGGSAAGAEAQRCARAAGIADRVRILGSVAEPSAAYQAADVFAFPTRYDPWGLVAIESLACGTPVVCGASAGVADEIRDGINGVIVTDVRDPRTLADAIVRSGTLTAGREEIRTGVRHLSWDRIIDRVEGFLAKATARKERVAS